MRIIRLDTLRQDDGSHIYFYLFRLLREIYGLIFTYCFADAALLFFEIEAALVNVGDKGDCLSKVDVDRLVLRDLLVVDIGILDRAVFYASGAARALVFS